jgi:hypothetical protein
VRKDASTKRHDESSFEFLDRVDDVVFHRVRVLLNEWFSHWPAERAESLRQRFKSRGDIQFPSAFWELYLYEGCRRLGDAISVEPTNPGSPRRRDLLVSVGAEEFAIEARLVGESDQARARKQRLSRALDLIDSIENTDFFVDLDVDKEGTGTPPGAQLRDKIRAWLKTLDRPELRRLLEAGQWRELPERLVSARDWTLRVRAIPVSDAAAASPSERHRLIGIYPGRSGWGNPDRLRDALRAKRPGKYGHAETAYVIGLLDTHPFAGSDVVVHVLFGDEELVIPRDPADASEPVVTRKANGFWNPRRNTRVSGVLYGRDVMPWSLASIPPTLWVNPWATTRVPVRLPWARYAEVGDDGKIAFHEPVIPPHMYFNLPHDWPGPEKPFAR